MSTPTIVPPTGARILRNVQVEIGGKDYGPATSTAVFTPAGSVVRFPGLAPEGRLSASTAADWTLDLTFVQDWTSTDSLAKELLEREGETVTVKFKPDRAIGAPAFSAEVTLAAPAIGGSEGFPTSTVSMGSTKPVPDYDDNPVTPNP